MPTSRGYLDGKAEFGAGIFRSPPGESFLPAGAFAGKGGLMPTPVSTVRVTGPLAPFAEGLRRFLLGEGYTPLSAANLLRLTAHLSRWMKKQRVPAGLTPTRVERFLHHRQRSGYTGVRSTRSLRSILSYLPSNGAIE